MLAKANANKGLGTNSAKHVVSARMQDPVRKCRRLDNLKHFLVLFAWLRIKAIVVQNSMEAYMMLQIGDNSAK